MKKSVLYSLHGFVWFCDLCIIFLASLAGNLWANENAVVSLVGILGIFAWSLALFYLGYSLFTPKFYLRQKYFTFILSILGASLIFPLIVNIEKVISAIAGNGWMGYSVSGYIQVLFLSLFICVSGVFLRIFINWINRQQEKKEFENEKLKSQLIVLNNQNNPHFIFNVLNNIDSLIPSKPAKASETINKLSELLRYIYSNSEKDKVSLHSEIEYIENYIELQTLRLDNDIKIQFDKENLSEHIQVVPMLFLPFIENVFKHGLADAEHPINIKFSSRKNELLFACKNSFDSTGNKNTGSGYGLSNIIKRLDLMYPSKYNLSLDNKEGIYSVSLVLHIDEN
ncbi:MAG: histidine kinase [Ignavibacteriales bacterium]|nr:histidine kinase [Ignavibacteriales bacterium]